MNVPVNHTHKNRQLYKDVQIAADEDWQIRHLKSLQSAYRTSPYFEFYEDLLLPFFQMKFKFILDVNFECHELIQNILNLDLNYEETSSYQHDTCLTDLRYLVNSRSEQAKPLQPYPQVFDYKRGFENNLSILDLLFNEGPNTVSYLKSQDMSGLIPEAHS